jgi:hypothetical protein
LMIAGWGRDRKGAAAAWGKCFDRGGRAARTAEQPHATKMPRGRNASRTLYLPTVALQCESTPSLREGGRQEQATANANADPLWVVSVES